MESLRIDILNPKAKSLLKNLSELNLIRIKKNKEITEFQDLLADLRSNTDEVPSMDEIVNEVNEARKTRYEK